MNLILSICAFILYLIPMQVLKKLNYEVGDQQSPNQGSQPLYIIQSNNKDYILTNGGEYSAVKKEWLSEIYVKELNKTKYKNIPQARYGVFILVINDKTYPKVIDTIRKIGIKELLLNK